MSSAPCPDEPAEYRLTALPGNRAAYVLATWGLVSLLPEATLHFEGEAVPVVRYGGDTDELVNVAAWWSGPGASGSVGCAASPRRRPRDLRSTSCHMPAGRPLTRRATSGHLGR